MTRAVKDLIGSIPVVGTAARTLYAAVSGRRPAAFPGSPRYWEDRYRAGGDSGAGSYNRLATFKADVLNDFVEKQSIESVIELGCGDGAQLQLATYRRYLGLDVSETAITLCRDRFGDDPARQFLHMSRIDTVAPADLALSLDVIYHLVEDGIFDEYMRRLFSLSTRYVIIYSSNEDQAWPCQHVRHRRFSRWVDENATDWRLDGIIKNKYPFDEGDQDNTSFADFHIYARAR